MTRLGATLLLALVGTAPAAAQDSVTIYRCTAADGAVTVQNDRPCPPGSRQQKRVMETVPPPPSEPPAAVPPEPEAKPELAPALIAPLVAAPATPPAPDAADPSAATKAPPAKREPPPPLYQCSTWDDDTYLSEDDTPAERCAPLRTTGLGGDPRRGVGVACQMTTDQCQRVPDEQLCTQWRERLNQAASTLRFGRVDDPAAAQAEVERLARIVFESTCGMQP